ncbi:hypothetical protein I2W78_25795 [Streptomyces spinoverrucosus]|uniref:hypothetical protein n=1 Tax=Streptomyces spinoverrucosus TaxID=284043 RepID=UPI0018C44074|nr:hypothetical protein [Streptomyces spinoverrucosus]MBG0855165.1 hypothetical protein [Streptomyces spinoverrucosus]
MKSLKAAAVLAGSLVAASVATPAFATYDPATVTPTSLNGAVNTITKGPIDVMPLKHQSDALNTENKDSVLSTVKETTTTLNKNGLLSGKPRKS